MEKDFLKRFWEILEDAEKIIQGEIPPSRETEDQKMNRLLDKIREGKDILKDLDQKEM